MASLGLKLYYLRTREKKLNQSAVAEALGVRQSTVSLLENERTAPQWALVVRLCQFYDVTPTYLADESRGVIPRLTERWGLRDALLTVGMTAEIPSDRIEHTDSQTILTELCPDTVFFDEAGAKIRREHESRAAATRALNRKQRTDDDDESALEAELREELLRKRKPR